MTRGIRWLAVLLSTALFVPAIAVPAAEEREAEPQDWGITPRIVGGSEVDPPGKYPFVAALIRSVVADAHQGQYCGGALIAPEWVLTAGHCVSALPYDEPGEIDVVLGRHDLSNDLEGERIGVVEIWRHPDYDGSTLANDLALVRLAQPAVAGLPISLVTPADAPLFAPGEVATVVGWGRTLGLPPGTPEDPAELREVSLPIVADTDCAAAYGDDFIFPDMLCAGDLEKGGIDACFGDSGGPLFVPVAAGWVQVGIVSGGYECASPGLPGLYARVAVYQAWITSVLSGDSPACQGQAATIVGTNGSDELVGTGGDDVIVSLGGDDTVWGYGGDDVICLGGGNDRAFGGAGDDWLGGGIGADYLDGNGGADVLSGGGGRDTLLGGEGPDSLLGNRGGDSLQGLSGDDSLQGGGGDDLLSGGFGVDRLRGGPGIDVLRGGPDADCCWGGEDVAC